jgi:hypothetical protein
VDDGVDARLGVLAERDGGRLRPADHVAGVRGRLVSGVHAADYCPARGAGQ